LTTAGTGRGRYAGKAGGRSGSDWAGTSAATCACPVTVVSDWPGRSGRAERRCPGPGARRSLPAPASREVSDLQAAAPGFSPLPRRPGPPPPTVTRGVLQLSVVRERDPYERKHCTVDLRCRTYVSFGTCANYILFYRLLALITESSQKKKGSLLLHPKINQLLRLS